MRGIRHEMELTKKFMETTMLKWNTKDAMNGKDVGGQVQFALRPIELFECVFPQDKLPQFMAMLNLRTDDKYQGYSFRAQMKLLRKLLGAEQYPTIDYKKVSDIPFIPNRGVAFHPIGFKKDEIGITNETSMQERL